MRLTTVQVEILIVRHLKRKTENDKVLKRLVGKYYALPKSYINKDTIFNCLFNIVKKYDLFTYPLKTNIENFFIYKFSFEPDFSDMWDAWIYRAKVLIRQSMVAKFPSYPNPAYFRNSIKTKT